MLFFVSSVSNTQICKITIKELKELIQEAIQENHTPLLSSPDTINEVSLMTPRARDMFGKRVFWRDLIEKKTKT